MRIMLSRMKRTWSERIIEGPLHAIYEFKNMRRVYLFSHESHVCACTLFHLCLLASLIMKQVEDEVQKCCKSRSQKSPSLHASSGLL